ncbi:hypothetical protein GOBAR_AA01131 [Gossypium barbadense]|uniref:RRM domain-containing protein n=1 Tax=Gossypium barbadense TaxID=3634 RepID=A0A2P5YV58_GOSBA|nr:hypothetical protein GOBAR_AA01131 [Gossypium barbadense]
MSEAGQHKVGGGGGDQGNGTGFGDTTYTKIFVGGLAWETKTDTLKRYFEQFGEILEAVVINDKTTGRSKGYGFVTFKDVDSAMRACYNPFPVIDGRRANCNLASLGAQKNRLSSASHSGIEKFSPSAPAPPPRVMEPSVAATPAFYRQFIPQYAFPYSAYGWVVQCSKNDCPLNIQNYYNVFGGQAFSSHYSSSGASGSAGVYMAIPTIWDLNPCCLSLCRTCHIARDYHLCAKFISLIGSQNIITRVNSNMDTDKGT